MTENTESTKSGEFIDSVIDQVCLVHQGMFKGEREDEGFTTKEIEDALNLSDEDKSAILAEHNKVRTDANFIPFPDFTNLTSCAIEFSMNMLNKQPSEILLRLARLDPEFHMELENSIAIEEFKEDEYVVVKDKGTGQEDETDIPSQTTQL